MAAAPGEHPLLSRRYTRWLIFVLLLVSVFNTADRAILSILAQPIKEDLHLTDTDLGILQGLGFAIFYSIMGIPLGLLAERVSRKKLMSACIAAWSVMTVCCGFATGFLTLLLGRIGVGVGEAGGQPLTSSLVADHIKPDRRGSALSLIALGTPLGFLFGQAVGGAIVSVWGWRAAFYALGIPGLLVALLVLTTLREPPRGLADGAVSSDPAPSLLSVVKYLLTKRTYLHLLAGMTISGFALNAVANFVLPLYLRGFDVSIAVIGAVFGLVSLTSNGLGIVAGGFGFDRLARRDPRWALWGPALALTICVPFYFGAFVSSELWLSLVCVWFGNFSLITYFAPSSATSANLVRPRMRATSAALSALIGGLLGAGLGPSFVGWMSDHFAESVYAGGNFIKSCPGGRAPEGAAAALDQACQAASTLGLRYALISVLVAFLWGAVHYFLASRTLKKDLYVPSEDGGEASAPSQA